MKPKIIKKKLIKNINGDILKFINNKDKHFKQFGEIYFSFINKNKIKAWKYNSINFANLIFPIGRVLTVVYDKNKKLIIEQILSQKDYNSLYLPPNYYYGFMGLDKQNMIVNLIDKNYSSKDKKKIDLNFFDFNWKKYKS